MRPFTAVLIAAGLVLAAYAWQQYQAAKEKERAANQWGSVIGLATKAIKIL